VLAGLSEGELEALAESTLAPAGQTRLDKLLAKNSQQQLSGAEEVELRSLLERIDQLTLLKTCARYTLQRQKTGAAHA
jgi:hypothetical protein